LRFALAGALRFALAGGRARRHSDDGRRAKEDVMVDVGERVPDVTLTGVDNEHVSPADFRGQKLVLYFYPKDDTTGCTREAQDFTALAADFENAGTWILGVSKDSPKSHAKFSGKYDLKVRLASDEDGSACEAFGTWIEKSMYGRKYMGIDRATFLIDRDGTIHRIWRKVKVAGHAEEVLEAARELP
jgi:peroxiredoxin Q/BCP